MTTVQKHYDQVLSDVYAWMFDGFDRGIEKNTAFFNEYKIKPSCSGFAIDLGAGCGFQSIPLAKAGFLVLSFDIDKKLLEQLSENSSELSIKTIQDDLINFDTYIDKKAELIVCMTDTLVHLETKDKVVSLFTKVFESLEDNGKFIITFRDLSHELSDLDRFIPVKSDDTTIFTCFLEYEEETVKVHDLVYKKDQGIWNLNKGYYRKLRLSQAWVEEQLQTNGFKISESKTNNGFVTLIATKPQADITY